MILDPATAATPTPSRRPAREPVRLRGGPNHRATVWPLPGATTVEIRIHDCTHRYDIDPATRVATYRRPAR